jgi:hypothetical protein
VPDSNGRKLLLSSVCRPFGEKYGDGFGVSYEGSHQLMWAQGIFRSRGTTTQWGIDFIAENLQIPTTTLHYPTMRQFIREIKKGYDYIGIAFVAPTLHKMIPMVQAIRKHAPTSKIILGGYGTALGDKVAPYADYICQGEGVAFMRKLLDEKVDAPIVQPVITQQQSLFSMPLLGKVGYVFAGLGCPNGCDFCATSHYFKRRHIKFLPDGPSILRAIERLRGIYPDMVDIWINDEDFLLNQSRGRGFLEAIRQSDLPPLAVSIFSSVKALSQFKVSELVEMGIDWIWVGYEGKRAGYAKMQGRPYRELFADLHDHGISVLASMIIGFDYQTPEIIQEEFDELMSMRPSMCQFLIYGPAHGTPAHARMKAEGRFRPEIMGDHSKQDGFYLGFKHPNIGADEMVSIQRNLYRKEFEQMGPSVFRVVDDWLTGYVNLRDHSTERVRAKAHRYKDMSHKAMMLLRASQRYVNRRSADWIERLYQRIAAQTGPMTRRERLAAKLIPAMLRYTAFKLRHNIGEQPEFTRRAFRMGKFLRLPEPALPLLDTSDIRG